MKKDFFSLALSVSAIVVPVYIFYTVLLFKGYYPLFTNSISFDAKVLYAKNRKITQVDLLAMGSSMTLNNLDSKVILDSIKLSYFNFACWGMQMGDTKKVLANYLPRYKPKYVLICSSLLDFITPGNSTVIDYINSPDFFKDHQMQYFYMRNYNSIESIKSRKESLRVFGNVVDRYESLKFDTGGAVLLNVPPGKISKERWNQHDVFPSIYTNTQYNELMSICSLLKTEHVSLVFVQPPIRKAYVSSKKNSAFIKAHYLRCKKIVEQYGGTYVNANDNRTFLDDKMFVDQFHLSGVGAAIFTKSIISDLRKTTNFK
jgi:hypothetical protein